MTAGFSLRVTIKPAVIDRRYSGNYNPRSGVQMSRKLIRDAVHGDIELGALEIELMDTPEFQRLRGIKQLGTAYLVFPSAVHTRFEHSLGTSWMAYRVLQAVRRSEAISQDAERLMRLSAPLHDVPHIPSGHTLELEPH